MSGRERREHIKESSIAQEKREALSYPNIEALLIIVKKLSLPILLSTILLLNQYQSAIAQEIAPILCMTKNDAPYCGLTLPEKVVSDWLGGVQKDKQKLSANTLAEYLKSAGYIKLSSPECAKSLIQKNPLFFNKDGTIADAYLSPSILPHVIFDVTGCQVNLPQSDTHTNTKKPTEAPSVPFINIAELEKNIENMLNFLKTATEVTVQVLACIPAALLALLGGYAALSILMRRRESLNDQFWQGVAAQRASDAANDAARAERDARRTQEKAEEDQQARQQAETHEKYESYRTYQEKMYRAQQEAEAKYRQAWEEELRKRQQNSDWEAFWTTQNRNAKHANGAGKSSDRSQSSNGNAQQSQGSYQHQNSGQQRSQSQQRSAPKQTEAQKLSLEAQEILAGYKRSYQDLKDQGKDPQEIYRKLIKTIHPDAQTSQKESFEAVTKHVNSAYRISGKDTYLDGLL